MVLAKLIVSNCHRQVQKWAAFYFVSSYFIGLWQFHTITGFISIIFYPTRHLVKQFQLKTLRIFLELSRNIEDPVPGSSVECLVLLTFLLQYVSNNILCCRENGDGGCGKNASWNLRTLLGLWRNVYYLSKLAYSLSLKW